jgi:hypothetical protein
MNFTNEQLSAASGALPDDELDAVSGGFFSTPSKPYNSPCMKGVPILGSRPAVTNDPRCHECQYVGARFGAMGTEFFCDRP